MRAYRIILAILALVATSCDVVPVGTIPNEYLRVSKVKALKFLSVTKQDKRNIESVHQLDSYQYRRGGWSAEWSAAQDGSYRIYRGGAAKSETKHVFFVIVWSTTNNRAAFVEVGGHASSGVYPPGLKSSP